MARKENMSVAFDILRLRAWQVTQAKGSSWWLISRAQALGTPTCRAGKERGQTDSEGEQQSLEGGGQRESRQLWSRSQKPQVCK